MVSIIQHASLQGALQVAAWHRDQTRGSLSRGDGHAGYTLAPLLWFLGTITGLIRSFSFSATKSWQCKPSPEVLQKR
jgi:hypothetical protein